MESKFVISGLTPAIELSTAFCEKADGTSINTSPFRLNRPQTEPDSAQAGKRILMNPREISASATHGGKI
jgi:hypothetical protein